jgi:hypothetical protein
LPLPIGVLPLPAQPATLIANSTEQAIARHLFMAAPKLYVIRFDTKLGSRVIGSPLVHKSHTGYRFAPCCVVLGMSSYSDNRTFAGPDEKGLARSGSHHGRVRH